MGRKSHVKLLEQFLNEKKPKGAPDWHDSDAPEAEGRFKELGIKELAAWLIKTRNKDIKKISGSLTQQVVFNRNDDPEYAEKMEKVRKEVYKQLGREDLLDNMKESFNVDEQAEEVNEKMKVFMNNILAKMIPAAFGASSNVKMREEMKAAVAAAIEPILKKYDYIVEQEEGRDTLGELNEMTLGQLERIEDYAEMIADRMEAGQQLESWMFSQITVALENLNAVHDGMDGSDGVKEGFSMDDHIANMRLKINEEKAKGNRGPLDNPDIEVALKKKAEESGIDIGLLRIVMRRGMDAWNSGHREGMGQEQWGYARVNAFIDKGEGTWGGADKDVAAEVKKK